MVYYSIYKGWYVEAANKGQARLHAVGVFFPNGCFRVKEINPARTCPQGHHPTCCAAYVKAGANSC
jgi:hypothetical protein